LKGLIAGRFPHVQRPYSSLQLRRTRRTGAAVPETKCRSAHACRLNGCAEVNYTIFEGTSEIQRLVVARAISGVHIP
jgi:hypothetical protein